MTKDKVSKEGLIAGMVLVLDKMAFDIATDEINLCMDASEDCDSCPLLEKCRGYWDRKVTKPIITSSLSDILAKLRSFRKQREKLNDANER